MHAYISIASWPSIMMEFPELIQQHELSEEDCEKPISDVHLETISRSLLQAVEVHASSA